MGSVATKPKQSTQAKKIAIDLREELDFSASNVDRANHIIRNVKVLSKDSPNKHGMDVTGTDYLPSAHNQVRALYEGMNVNIGHPPRNDPDAERAPRDRNGVLFNVKTLGNETFADWQLIPSHDMTPRVMDCAANKRLHNQFALSHNAKGYGYVREGRYQVTEIPKVRSVDLVCDGGTNRGLFESKERNMASKRTKKFRDLIESATAKIKSRFKPLLEMYEDVGDTMVEPPPAPDATPGAPPSDAGDAGPGHMDHLGSLLKAIIEDVKNGHMESQEAIDKILAAVKVMEETKEKGEGEGTGDGGAEGGEGEGEGGTEGKGSEMEESREKELDTLRKEKQGWLIKELFESRGLAKPSALQIKVMLPLNEMERTAYMEEQAKLAPKKTGGSAPRTNSGRAADVRESAEDRTDMSDEALKKRVESLRK